MSHSRKLMALDVGAARIGVALADDAVRIAIPFTTVLVDGNELPHLAEIAAKQAIDTLVVGYPRNQSGEPTAQTEAVKMFAEQLTDFGPTIVFQDESLTSVMAEQRLTARGKPFEKTDIDMEAAVLILQDYLESHRG